MSISARLHLTPAGEKKQKTHSHTQSIICHRPLSLSSLSCHSFNSFQFDILCLYKLVRLAWTRHALRYDNASERASAVSLSTPQWRRSRAYYCSSALNVQHIYGGAFTDCGVCSVPAQITRRWRKSQVRLRGQTSRIRRGWRAAAPPRTLGHILYVKRAFLTSIPPCVSILAKI